MSTMPFCTKPTKVDFDEGEQAAMVDAKQMMTEIQESIVELQSYNDWQTVVMKSKIPVILECFADWCNPCQKLMPILEKKAIEANGQFKLVKVNIDLLPEIATGLNVRSVPAVFLVSGGNVMDTFTGVPSDERIDDFVNTAKLLDKLSHDTKTMDQIILAAEDHIKSEDYHTAIEILDQTLITTNYTEEQQCRILLNLAFSYAKMGNENDAKEKFIAWQEKFRNQTLDSECQSILHNYQEAIESLQENEETDPKLQNLRQSLEQDPENIEAMFNLAEYLIFKEKYEEAISLCVDIIAIDRNWNNSAPHKLLLEVFNKLGAQNELVKQGKKKLTRVLF